MLELVELGAAGDADAGIVEQVVEAPAGFEGIADQRLDGREVGDVDLDRGGWRLAVAEILTPVTRSLMMAVVGLAVAAAGAVGSGLAAGSFAESVLGGRMLELVALGFALLPLVLASAAYASSIQSLLAMAFPAWAVVDARSPQRGPAATGQRLLLGLGHMLAMLAGGILPALAGGAAFLVLRLLGGPFRLWELPLLALPAAAVLLAEASFLLAWVGKLWDDLDPAQELLDG